MCRLRTTSLPHPALRLDSFLLRAPQNRQILWVGKGRNRVFKITSAHCCTMFVKYATNHTLPSYRRRPVSIAFPWYVVAWLLVPIINLQLFGYGSPSLALHSPYSCLRRNDKFFSFFLRTYFIFCGILFLSRHPGVGRGPLPPPATETK